MIWICWVGFILFVLAMLALDLGVFHRRAHVVHTREALLWSAFWIGLALLFTLFIYFGYEHHWLGLGVVHDAVDGKLNDGASASLKYITGYVIEKSLSVDNIFVIAMIFAVFAVPAEYQHRLLFWGILGALVMRGAMIGAGAALITRFDWLLYVFGLLLIFMGIKMLFTRESHSDPSDNFGVRMLRRVVPVTSNYHGQQLLARERGRVVVTPMSLALVTVECTDLIFAVDSIPAIFAITADPFLVFTSNVFAILGLRSLYFALAGMISRFRYLKVALSMVLLVVGGKMLAHDWLHGFLGDGFNLYLLGIVLLILVGGVAFSLLRGRRLPFRESRASV